MEVRWTAETHSGKRKTTWPVAHIIRVVRTEAGERRYDVLVPGKLEWPGAMLRDVRVEDIKRKRQRGSKKK